MERKLFLIDVLKTEEDGFDVCDVEFDSGVYFTANEEVDDYYDKVLLFLAQNIEVVTFKKGWFTPCKISQFMDKFRNAFDKWMNNHYIERWCPKNHPKYTIDDEEFYDFYIELFEQVVSGGLSESDYQELYGYLMEEKKNVK